MSEITIARRFRGPEDSGNGGYTCGMVARFIEGDAEVGEIVPVRITGAMAYDLTAVLIEKAIA